MHGESTYIQMLDNAFGDWLIVVASVLLMPIFALCCFYIRRRIWSAMLLWLPIHISQCNHLSSYEKNMAKRLWRLNVINAYLFRKLWKIAHVPRWKSQQNGTLWKSIFIKGIGNCCQSSYLLFYAYAFTFKGCF